MNSIVKISELLAQILPNEWWNNYNFNEDDIPSDHYNRFLIDVNSLKDDIFDILNSSILSGEYVAADNFEIDLKELKKSIGQLPVPFPTSELLQEKLNSDFNQNLIQCLTIAVTSYIDFVIWLKVRLKSNYGLVYQINSEIGELFEDKEFDDNTNKSLGFFTANITIAKHDHFLTPQENDFQYLISYSSALTKSPRLTGNKYSVLLRFKCDFLLCKWILRKRFINGPLYAVINSVEKEFTINDYKNDLFKSWIEYLEIHYQFSTDWETYVKQGFNDLRTRNISTLNYLDLHRLIKYYKDVIKNYSNLKAIREELENKYTASKTGSNVYNIFVHAVVLNYAINNEFSLLIEDSKVDDDKVQNLYDKVMDIQAMTGINNFFPQHKYVKFLIDRLKDQSHALAAITKLESQRININKCKSIFQTYEKNVKWAKKNYNYVFYLPYDECLINTNNSDSQKLFIASSFVMPLDKRGYMDEFEEFKKEIFNIEKSIEIFENINSELIVLRDSKAQIEELKKDLQEREIKSIETLSIFTTIVTFVFASVVEFKFITNAFQAVLFTLCLSASLSFFVFLIVLTRTNDFIRTLRRYFWNGSMVLVFISLLWFLILYATDLKKFVSAVTQQITTSPITQSLTKPSPPVNNLCAGASVSLVAI